MVPSHASAFGVVQQDQPSEGVAVGPFRNDVVIGMFDLGAQRVTVGSQALRRPDGTQLDLRPHDDGVHRRYRLAEWGRFG